MTQNRNKLYSILLISCIAGYIWLYFNFNNMENTSKEFHVCVIKHLTNIPCPSCGSTRSILSITKGNFMEALQINPMGFIVTVIMFSVPFWIFIDIATRRQTLFEFYRKMETYLKRPQLAIPLILLVVINWIWNITKGI
ncbi:MAG: DUF2752 domain-containing protein [Saprospiraceae bacterium]|uniref:DUF2752 domain-containing protein n=1 Tax=Candidatus Defluviibacterium haderslevense TaxID=2981993 RepID=A0A9D7S7F6_9BACT|nr:DUF2752 domain-containing protein [Candidatus Defluviibacterium haderslevense]MBL0236347.1 DUF2752 domain-containing protein [Candidatus Defluviibacterium haderslevense]